MTRSELHACLVTMAEQAAEIRDLVTAELPKDEEGFPIPDNSDLSDAWQTLDHLHSRLIRVALAVGQEGVKEEWR